MSYAKKALATNYKHDIYEKTSCGQSKLNEKPKYILRSRFDCHKFVFTCTS